MSDFEPLNAVFSEIQAGSFNEALASLTACQHVLGTAYASEWWRLKGLTHTHQSDWDDAETAYVQAVHLAAPRSAQLGAALVNYGSLLGRLERRLEAMQVYLQGRDIYRACRFDQGLVLAGYNLGWSLVQLGRTDDAARAFEDVLVVAERPAGAYHRPYLHLGRSLVASLRGDHDLAVSGARWTSDRADGLMRVRALRRLAESVWLSGREGEARLILDEAEAMPACQSSGQQADRVRTLRALVDRDPEWADARRAALSREDQARALLLLADVHWRGGRHRQALVSLVEASALQEPHVWPLLASRFADLYAWGRAEGAPVPFIEVPVASREIRVFLRGAVRVEVNGAPVHARLTTQGAAVVAFLREYGPSTQATVLREALNSGRSADLTKAVQRVNLLIGDAAAVQVRGTGPDARWHLANAWQWTTVNEGVGALLPGLDSPFTGLLHQR